MKSRTRYTLIAAGIVAFILLSPFIYFFVRGMRYDFQNKRFIQTGTLVAKTEPKGAFVYINGEKTKKTNVSMRFMFPGDYNVEIKKPGYMSWSKRLNIRSQYVTWANLNIPAIPLFFERPEKQSIAENVLDMKSDQKRAVWLTADKVFAADLDSPEKHRELALPASSDKWIIGPSYDQNIFVLSKGFAEENATDKTVLIFDLGSNKLVDITGLLEQQAAYSPTNTFQASENVLQFSDNGDLYQLQNGTLYKVDWRNNRKEISVDGVLAFKANGNGLYYIKAEEKALGIKRSLIHAQYPSLTETVLLPELPAIRSAEMFLTRRNQLLILADSTLYSVGDKLNKVSDYVNKVAVDNTSQVVLFSTANEISIYDPANGSSSLVTRSSQLINNPSSAVEYGWVFFQNDNRLQNIEIDTRDHQNNYTFAELDENGKFFVDEQMKTIVLLNKGKLEVLKIR